MKALGIAFLDPAAMATGSSAGSSLIATRGMSQGVFFLADIVFAVAILTEGGGLTLPAGQPMGTLVIDSGNIIMATPAIAFYQPPQFSTGFGTNVGVVGDIGVAGGAAIGAVNRGEVFALIYIETDFLAIASRMQALGPMTAQTAFIELAGGSQVGISQGPAGPGQKQQEKKEKGLFHGHHPFPDEEDLDAGPDDEDA